MHLHRNLALLICATASAPASAIVVSTFDSGAEGWTVDGGTGPTWIATGGNPGGYISTQDSSNNVGEFVAPESFRGDHSFAFGQTLSFDLRLEVGPAGDRAYAARIFGDSGHLRIKGSFDPSTDWTTFTFILDESDNWTWNNNVTQATNAQIQSVLSNITDLRITLDWVGGFGNDITHLDNVMLVPEPATLISLAFGISFATRRAKSGRLTKTREPGP